MDPDGFWSSIWDRLPCLVLFMAPNASKRPFGRLAYGLVITVNIGGMQGRPHINYLVLDQTGHACSQYINYLLLL